MPTLAAFGTWSSPITPALLTEGAVGLSQVQVWSDRIWWVESRPSEAGRQVLVSVPASGARPTGTATEAVPAMEAVPVMEAVPAGHSVRTRVHEYGGRCAAGHGDTVVWSNWSDQRLWRDDHATVGPLTPEPDEPGALRYADPVISPDGRWVVCVRERHAGGQVDNELVAVDLSGQDGASAGVVLAAGHDFYAAPRLSPAGDALAWLSWDHPDMPWDHTDLHVAPFAAGRLGEARRVAGAHGESISQPRWSPDGVLHFVSDRSGWWNIHRLGPAGDEPVVVQEADFAGPDWVFGQSSYTFLPDGRLVATWHAEGGASLGVAGGGTVRALDLPYTSFDSLAGVDGGVVAVVGSPATFPAVVRIDVEDATVEVLAESRRLRLDPGLVSEPVALRYPTGDGGEAHAWWYPPTNPGFDAPGGERPPLIVMSHGGPTSATSATLSLGVQYWTSRGFAVVDVDYRGSSGYGRAYRDALRGGWGVIDVEDCSAVVAHLAAEGLVDARRAVIRGGSAGGFTTLACLTFTDAFAAGASLYGVADLEMLARDTHKFEARYLDRLVGPWPGAEATYRARSPIHHLDRLRCPIILFQGEDDQVVPRSQADRIEDALSQRGVTVEYHLFPGEQHGFRRAGTIEAVARAELAFYGRVLGFSPAG